MLIQHRQTCKELGKVINYHELLQNVYDVFVLRPISDGRELAFLMYVREGWVAIVVNSIGHHTPIQ